MKVLHSSPGLEDLWQVHFSLLSGQEYTVPGAFIANTVDDQAAAMPIAPAAAPAPGPGAPPPPAHHGQAYSLKGAARWGEGPPQPRRLVQRDERAQRVLEDLFGEVGQGGLETALSALVSGVL